MKLMSCNAREAYDIKCKRTYVKWLDILMDFKNSSDTCVQVLDFGHVTSHSCAYSINRSIHIYHLYELVAFERGSAVFIAKKDYL